MAKRKPIKVEIEIEPAEFQAIVTYRKLRSVLCLLGVEIGPFDGLVERIYHAVQKELPEANQ